MRTLSFHRLAAAELEEAAYYYQTRSAGLGSIFVNAVEDCAQSILEFPSSGRVIRSAIRQRRVARFPYAIVYSTSIDHVRVLAIMHLKRRPTYWVDRR